MSAAADGRGDDDPAKNMDCEAAMIKIHFIPKGYANALCNSKHVATGRFAVRSLTEFKAVEMGERCVKCEATLKRMGRLSGGSAIIGQVVGVVGTGGLVCLSE